MSGNVSVLIKGLKMPNGLAERGFVIRGDGRVRTFNGAVIDYATAVPAADVVERPRWIPVTERLPEENGRYLVRYVRDIDLEGGVHSDEVRTMRFVDAQWRFPFICNPDVRKFVTREKVTHWMPLPEPPKEEE